MAKKKEDAIPSNLNIGNAGNITINNHSNNHSNHNSNNGKTNSDENGSGWLLKAFVGGFIALAVAVLGYYATTGMEKGKVQVFESNSPGVLRDKKR